LFSWWTAAQNRSVGLTDQLRPSDTTMVQPKTVPIEGLGRRVRNLLSMNKTFPMNSNRYSLGLSSWACRLGWESFQARILFESGRAV
jgi:hypothetical protein